MGLGFRASVVWGLRQVVWGLRQSRMWLAGGRVGSRAL